MTEEKRVLALKYRPHKFEDLIGQSIISQTLSLALDTNRLSHAYLFSGLRGSGKTSTARIMAKALVCQNGPTSKPCEECANCLSANSNKHLDIIEMDAASNRGIDDIKTLIEHTKYKPSLARFKVFIIDEVHMLTTQAFNALLKTLEEPPAFVKFILATTDALKLPATILSRTQHFRFNKISQIDIVHHLSHILNNENINFETSALEIIARSGQGSLRDSLTLLDQAIIFSKGSVNTNLVIEMLGLIEPHLMEEIFEIILEKKDFEQILKKLESYDVAQVCDEMTIFLKNKMFEKNAKYNLLYFDRFFRILGDAKHLLALNSDSGFVLILTFLKMIEATNLKSIDEIINEVKDIKIDKVNFKNTKPTDISRNIYARNLGKEDNKVKVSNEIIGESKILYEKVIKQIFERDYTLGECFEKNFIYQSYTNKQLQIISYALDEERKLLLKNYGLIKTIIYDIFGNDTEIDFKKANIEKKTKIENKPQINEKVVSSQISNNVNENMNNEVQKKFLSSNDFEIEDILNSKMLNKAKELFDIKKITVKPKKTT